MLRMRCAVVMLLPGSLAPAGAVPSGVIPEDQKAFIALRSDAAVQQIGKPPQQRRRPGCSRRRHQALHRKVEQRIGGKRTAACGNACDNIVQVIIDQSHHRLQVGDFLPVRCGAAGRRRGWPCHDRWSFRYCIRAKSSAAVLRLQRIRTHDTVGSKLDEGDAMQAKPHPMPQPDLPASDYAQHLLVWALRRIVVRRAVCPIVAHEFANACGEDAGEVLATLRVFIIAYGSAARRRMNIGHPGGDGLTGDERQLLDLIAAAQDGDQPRFEANLCWIARPERRHCLVIAARALATAFALHGLWLCPAAPPAVSTPTDRTCLPVM
jgi:hypothetical protein